LGPTPIVASYPVFPADAAVGALVSRYAAAAAPLAGKVVGRLAGPVTKALSPDREFIAGDFVADAALFASRSAGADMAFTNPGGVRTDVIPAADGSVTYGQIFSMQPFGNTLVVKALTGAQLKALLEQQFESGKNSVERPTILLPSKGFFFAYDVRRPSGQRIVQMRLNGKPIDPARTYKVTVNNFLASGGDSFTVLADAPGRTDLGLDLDAIEAYLKTNPQVPQLGRIKNLGPSPAP
jgi:5'-nucleotidase